MKIAISGASGKTGYRIAEELIKKNIKVKLLTRKNSILPDSLLKEESNIYDLSSAKSLDSALSTCDALIIATGARPSVDLTGPARIDALGVRNQVEACKRTGIKRIILVSSLCTGRFFHPLNLFGLILIWKRVGENYLISSNLDWTIIRPGGLKEDEEELQNQGIKYSPKDTQEEGSIPRRLVAQACVEAFTSNVSIGKIIEITSSVNYEKNSLSKAIQSFNMT